MNTFRAMRPRVLRPHLSLRHHALRRHQSSTIASPEPTFFRRNRSLVLGVGLALGLGALAGQIVIHSLSPPRLPEPWSREDGILIADLNKRIDDDFKVKILRGKCLGVTKALKGGESGWVELIKPPLDLSDKGSKETRGRHLLQQMEGAGGLGVERLFWDRREKKLVAIVWFGGSLCGWPGVTHGGAIATLLAEKISIAAALAENSGAQESALAAATPQRMPGTGNHAKMFAPVAIPAEPAQLSLSYVKPTYANKFYVIRVAPAIAADESAREVEGPGKPGQVSALAGGSEWEARVETMAATNCVLSRAKFAPGTGVQGLVEKVDSGVGTGYREFKEWMWPSRQASTSGLS